MQFLPSVECIGSVILLWTGDTQSCFYYYHHYIRCHSGILITSVTLLVNQKPTLQSDQRKCQLKDTVAFFVCSGNHARCLFSIIPGSKSNYALSHHTFDSFSFIFLGPAYMKGSRGCPCLGAEVRDWMVVVCTTTLSCRDELNHKKV